MDFEFSKEERAFAEEVEKFLDVHATPDVADVTRENMAQIVDTPARRAFMKKLSAQGWIGMTWPKEYGGQEKQGVYEYILNEALARRGAPQIGKGVGIVGKTLIRHASDKLKREFLPQIVRGEIEFAVGYSEPQAGSDAANMQLKAEPVAGRLALERPEDLDHLGPLRRLVLARRTHGSGQTKARRHQPVPDPHEPPGSRRSRRRPRSATSAPIPSSSTTCSCPATIWSASAEAASSTSRRPSISSASRCSRSRRSSRSSRSSSSTCRPRSATGEPLRGDPVVRQRIAQLATQCEVARVLGLRFVAASTDQGQAADRRGLGVQALRDAAVAARGQRGGRHRGRRARSSACTPPDAPLRGRPR